MIHFDAKKQQRLNKVFVAKSVFDFKNRKVANPNPISQCRAKMIDSSTKSVANFNGVSWDKFGVSSTGFNDHLTVQMNF